MRQNLVRVFAGIALTTVGSCRSATGLAAPVPQPPKFSCIANSATMRLPAELRASLPTLGSRGSEDAFVAISQIAPGGFAGLFLDRDRIVMSFVDTTLANRSCPEIQAAFKSVGYPMPGSNTATAEIRAARWTFVELDEWYRYIVPKLTERNSGISSSDIDEKANTVAFGIIDEVARAKLEARLASFGVSCNLVTTEIQPYAVAM
jgi:hypothetical protein